MFESADDAQFAEWVTAAQHGDPRGFEALVRVMERPLLGFVRARGCDDIEGVVNDVLVRAFSDIHTFVGEPAQFRAWVFRIARNLLIDQRRRAERRPREVLTAPDALPEGFYYDASADRMEEAERAETLLAHVTAEQREVLLLRIVAGLSVEDTAEVLGRRPGAVRALQHRALNRLRQEMSRRA